MRTLLITKTNGGEMVVPLKESGITIGRTSACDVALTDPALSRAHCRVLHKDGKVIIQDLKSANGTALNGQRLEYPQVLKEGDEVAIGNTTLRLAPEENQQVEESASTGSPVDDRYMPMTRLHAGARGSSYVAMDTKMNREVFVKHLSDPGEAGIESFAREHRLMEQLLFYAPECRVPRALDWGVVQGEAFCRPAAARGLQPGPADEAADAARWSVYPATGRVLPGGAGGHAPGRDRPRGPEPGELLYHHQRGRARAGRAPRGRTDLARGPGERASGGQRGEPTGRHGGDQAALHGPRAGAR